MAKITGVPTVELHVRFEVTEDEARALDALAGYGDDAFIKRFYEFLGEHYMKPHEKGLRLFLQTIRAELAPVLSQADRARKAFTEVKPRNGHTV